MLLRILHREGSTYQAARSFRQSEAGAIAPIFGVMLVPILVMAVFSIDFSRSLTSRTTLQDAVDAAGLALAHLPANTTQADLNTAVTTWVKVNLSDATLKPTISVTSSNRVVMITATASVPSLAPGLTNLISIPIRAASTVRWGNNIELALVLDNTYSMNDNNKLVDLKSAANNLINTLSASAGSTPNALKVSVVPFSVTVNVGSSYQGASWVTGTQPTTGYGSDLFTSSADRFSLLSSLHTTWGGCVESRPIPYDIQDTAPTAANPATMFVPYFAPDENDGTWVYNGSNVPHMNNYLTDSNKDNGLVGSPAKYSTSPKTGPSGWGGALGPGWRLGPNMGCGSVADPGLQPLLRLTTDMTAVKGRINAMFATGETHIPIGLMWGWHVLSPNLPFADGSAYTAPNVTKVAVLVTDGANTYFTGINGGYNSSYSGYGYLSQNRPAWNAFPNNAPAAINDRLTKLCSNMKAAGIVMYTVPVQITDTTIKSLLQGCASSPSNYVEVTTSAGMQSAFSSIASSISRLRIAH